MRLKCNKRAGLYGSGNGLDALYGGSTEAESEASTILCRVCSCLGNGMREGRDVIRVGI